MWQEWVRTSCLWASHISCLCFSKSMLRSESSRKMLEQVLTILKESLAPSRTAKQNPLQVSKSSEALHRLSKDLSHRIEATNPPKPR